MKQAVLSVAAILAAALSARAQVVKDFVEVRGARANMLSGRGIVTGLGGNGDSPRGETARLMANMLQRFQNPDILVQSIQSRNAALVTVSAELKPFQKTGTRLDVIVAAVGDARTLAGGVLQVTDLWGPSGRPVDDPRALPYALASGRLIVQGDERRGNPTSAEIPGGAILERQLRHEFVDTKSDGRKAFTLVLRRPDLTMASQLTRQINETALVGTDGRAWKAATSIDGGSIEVLIPTSAEYEERAGVSPAVDFTREPVRWLERILNRPVALVTAERAVVLVDDATKTVSWTGEVLLREGSVMVAPPAAGARPSIFHARDGQRLSDFMDRNSAAMTEQQMVDVIRALRGAGLIKAEVKSR